MKNKNAKKPNWFKIISSSVYLIAMVLLTVISIPLIKSFFSGNADEFRAFIDGFGAFGVVIMMFIQIAQIIVALIPGEVVEFVAGTLYGPIGGLIFCLTGVAVGQTLIFLAVRIIGKDLVEKAAGSKIMAKFKFLQNESRLRAVIFLLYFVPGTPKDLLTYLVPLTKIKLLDFTVITLIARIPSVLSSTFGGNAFASGDIVTLVAIYAVIALFSLIGMLAYRYWEQKHDTSVSEE